MKTEDLKTYQTPLEDLRESDLEHYEVASSAVYHYSSGVRRAINFWYDYRQLSFLGRLKLAFTFR